MPFTLVLLANVLRVAFASVLLFVATATNAQPYNAISVGSDHVCAVRTNGGVQCWGSNLYGQLGNGTKTSSATPVDVVGVSTATSVAVGSAFSCALLQGGRVQCWGNNDSYQLGNGSQTQSSVPTNTSGTKLFSAIAAGDSHVCGVLLSGSYACWGANYSGQQGDNTVTSNPVPFAPSIGPALVSNAVAVSSGSSHTCVLLATNEVKCWGANSSGQLGLGAAGGNVLVPTLVPSLTNATSVSAGSAHTCARTTTGGAMCWGRNFEGQAGLNPTTTFSQNAPVAVPSMTSLNVTAVSTGYDQSCAIVADQTVRCWGANTLGQLGNGTYSIYSFNAVTVAGLSGIQSISSSQYQTCGLTTTGAAICWGGYDQGTSGGSAPLTVFGLTGATGVSAGGASSCALVGGAVKCWGDNSSGALGNNSFVDSAIPVAVTGISTATAITGGGRHQCARLATGAVQCWGANDWDTLGHSGQTGASAVPLDVTNLAAVAAVSAGGSHSCAALQNQTVQCWGQGIYGQLGANLPSGNSSAIPLTVGGISTATGIAAGGSFSCALLAGGGAKCWGANDAAQLGNGTVNAGSTTPVTVSNVSTATAITAGSQHACVLRGDGTVWCWGANSFGQVGGGATGPYWAGAQVLGINNATAISAGGQHTCALLSTGDVRCWGDGQNGQLGNNGNTYSHTPVAVLGVTNATHIAAGGAHTCARLQTGSVVCWGYSGSGRLGDGSGQLIRLTPQFIASGKCGMDLDGDGIVSAASDGLMLVRALLGFSGSAVTTNAVAAAGTRRTWGEIRAHLRTSCGVQGLAP